ncbi:hypothetical protein Tco_1388028, partial [Tanacetum coccineum]
IKSAKNGTKFFGTSVLDMIMYSYERNHGSLMEFKDGLDMATMGFILDDNKKLKRLLIVFAKIERAWKQLEEARDIHGCCTFNYPDHLQFAALASFFIPGDKSRFYIPQPAMHQKPKTLDEITHDLCPVTEENNKTECKGVLTDSPTDFRLDSLDARMHMVVSKVGLAGLFAIVLNISFPNKNEES